MQPCRLGSSCALKALARALPAHQCLVASSRTLGIWWSESIGFIARSSLMHVVTQCRAQSPVSNLSHAHSGMESIMILATATQNMQACLSTQIGRSMDLPALSGTQLRTCGAWCVLFNGSAVPDRATAKQLEGQSAAVLQAGWGVRTLPEQRPGPALCSAHGSRDPHCCLCYNSCLAATATGLRHGVRL